MNNLLKVVTRKRNDWGSNLRPFSHKSTTLTITPPDHIWTVVVKIDVCVVSVLLDAKMMATRNARSSAGSFSFTLNVCLVVFLDVVKMLFCPKRCIAVVLCKCACS